MPINYFNKNVIPELIAGNYDVFAHGCNCFCTMGAGIAKSLKKQFPTIYAADKKTKNGDKSKLGTIIPVEIIDNKYIINAYTQYDYGGMGKNADYKAIKKCMEEINKFMNDKNLKHLVLPKIGAGLAGGNWDTIERIILETISNNIKIDVYYL